MDGSATRRNSWPQGTACISHHRQAAQGVGRAILCIGSRSTGADQGIQIPEGPSQAYAYSQQLGLDAAWVAYGRILLQKAQWEACVCRNAFEFIAVSNNRLRLIVRVV